MTSLSIPTTFKRPRQSDAKEKRTWSTNGVSLQEKAASIRSMVVRLFAATGFANGFAGVVNCANGKLRVKTCAYRLCCGEAELAERNAGQIRVRLVESGPTTEELDCCAVAAWEKPQRE